MNNDIKKIIEKNKYRSSFYKSLKRQSKKSISKKPDKPNKTNNNTNQKFNSFLNKVLISIMILFVLLISKKDDRLSVIYKTTFRNMNIVKIEYFITHQFSGLFPPPDDEYKYVSAPVLDYTNTESYRDGVIVDLALGAPVQSSVDGRVIEFYQDDDLGKVVVIQDINNYLYHYGYLDDINVKLYQHVNIGETIGIGKSKADLDTYYYLSVTHNDEPVDVLNMVTELSSDGTMMP